MIRRRVLAAFALLPLTANAPMPRFEGAAFARAMIDPQNAARRLAGVPDLVWDDALAADAREWADHLAQTSSFYHSDDDRGRDPQGEGENLFMGTEGAYSYQQMVGMWVDEKKFYRDGVMPNLSTTGNWDDVGHYTQVIWRSTKRVGCALASNGDVDYLVCRYSEPGNFMGESPR